MGCTGSNIKNEDTEISSEDFSNVLQLREGMIGRDATVITPYGTKPCIYADWSSTAQSLEQVEQFMEDEVLPLYASTCSLSSTGCGMAAMKEESRSIIASAVNADANEDVVLFTGSGSTAAVGKIVQSLGLHVPLPEGADESLRPIVFTSSYEHPLNLQLWRESVADVVTIDLSPVTGVCLKHLHAELHKYHHRKLKIGAFCVVSSVTGMVTAVNDIAIFMHMFGGLAVFDYTTAAPHVHINMNPTGDKRSKLAYKDAIVLSGHMFVGGPGSSGILIAKKAVLSPSVADELEIDDTSNILSDIRAGLAIQIHSSLDIAWVVEGELAISQRVFAALSSHPSICILRSAPANACIPHLPIFSFLIRYCTYGSSIEETAAVVTACMENNRFLHYNFVCALLNDLFGIQCRGGCMCEGTYSSGLLGVSDEDEKKLETALLDKVEVLRPGYTRLSLPYWMTEEEINYVVKAVKFVADHGSKFLPMYRFEAESGVWSHMCKPATSCKKLTEFRLVRSSSHSTASKKMSLLETFAAACDALNNVPMIENACSGQLPAEHAHLRWFVVAGDTGGSVNCIVNPPDFDEIVHLDQANAFQPSPIKSQITPRYLDVEEILSVIDLNAVSQDSYEASVETDDSSPRDVVTPLFE